MPRFTANLSQLFEERPLMERFDAAASAGFRSVELPNPYTQDLAALREALQASRLAMALIDLPPAGAASGASANSGFSGPDPGFRARIAMAIDYAHGLGCERVNCPVERVLGGDAEAFAQPGLPATLGYAATLLAAAGLRLVVGPTCRLADFEALHASVGNPNLLLHYGGATAQCASDIADKSFLRLLPMIGHVRFVPDDDGRGQRGVDLLPLQLDRLGYAGWISCGSAAAMLRYREYGWLM